MTDDELAKVLETIAFAWPLYRKECTEAAARLRTPSAPVPESVVELSHQLVQFATAHNTKYGLGVSFDCQAAAALIQRYVEGMERLLPELQQNMVLAKLEQIWLSDAQEFWRCSIRKLHTVHSYNGEGETPRLALISAIAAIEKEGE